MSIMFCPREVNVVVEENRMYLKCIELLLCAECGESRTEINKKEWDQVPTVRDQPRSGTPSPEERTW